MALSVPRATSAPSSSIRAALAVFPKKRFERGHMTMGIPASAHARMSASVASTMWTTKAGSRDITNSMSSRILSETWRANGFPAA